jgi:hypothetical protein
VNHDVTAEVLTPFARRLFRSNALG